MNVEEQIHNGFFFEEANANNYINEVSPQYKSSISDFEFKNEKTDNPFRSNIESFGSQRQQTSFLVPNGACLQQCPHKINLILQRICLNVKWLFVFFHYAKNIWFSVKFRVSHLLSAHVESSFSIVVGIKIFEFTRRFDHKLSLFPSFYKGTL